MMEARTEKIGIHVERLMKLRDIAIPFAREKQAAGQLNFGLFMVESKDPKECGTEGCLLGWMVTLPEFRADGWSRPTSPTWAGHRSIDRTHYADMAAEYFGISPHESKVIFGAGSVPLERRAAVVNDLIDQKLAATPTRAVQQ